MPSLHDRLVQLERLVKSIASKPSANSRLDSDTLGQPAKTPHVDTSIDGRSDRGSMRISASELPYVDGNHWAAIMDSIADLKNHFDREEQLRLVMSPDQIQDDTEVPGDVDMHASRHSLLLYGGHRPASQAEILAALPPKDAVDRYISRYFNRLELVSCKCALLTKM